MTLFMSLAMSVAFSLPPAYVSKTRLIVESSQIPDQLAHIGCADPHRLDHLQRHPR